MIYYESEIEQITLAAICDALLPKLANEGFEVRLWMNRH